MRSKKLEGLVEQGFITESQAQYLEEAIARKETIIISGHRGHGLTQLFGSLLMSIDKETTSFKQVRKPESDFDTDADYFIIGDLKDVDWEAMLTKVVLKDGANMMVMKAPEYTYSIMKILRDAAKQGDITGKVFQTVECKKIGEEKKVAKITKTIVNENGKAVRKNFEG
ncbi:hypothetical protein JR334_06880 [Clostridia bacterium]|nr:hypothetical protein JR334_06880 [Clostridia bacterium]